MKSSSRIDIVFGVDDSYTDPLIVTAYSIIRNNTTFDQLFFYIITSGVRKESQQRIMRLETQFPNVHVAFSAIDDTQFKDFPLHIKHITAIAYGRFLTAELFPDLDKILYLDTDILIRGDLGELWRTDIERACIAGSHKEYINTEFPGYKESIGLEAESTYINSGVMLMNLARIRSLNKTQELLDNATRLKDIVRIQDQDIINITFRDEISRVDKRYNYTNSDRRQAMLDDADVVVVHFNTSNKPWNSDFISDSTNRVFAVEYMEYRNEIITSKV